MVRVMTITFPLWSN